VAPPPVVEFEDVALGVDPTDAETAAAFLARLRVATVTGRLPEDVGRWAVDAIAEHLPGPARRMARDRCLRTAAALLSGSVWAKACRLKAEILIARGYQSRRARLRVQQSTVPHHVTQALAIDPATPASVRQLLRILGVVTPAACAVTS
jgi:hypothetical protein